ncbi:hypothetical protein [Marinobacter sp. AN1]|uniref:hypothetical protein n=1 Tax=Marinobacter sp. AN1 TaxID=2886046 RepID=UPI00222E304B|nr:hypothetical protein [Marinobacter sp. AN1]UZD66513.1 hypothetical protein LJ360_03960 [Marinobacter sp. AN1]
MQLFFGAPFAVREAIGKWNVRRDFTSGYLQFIFMLIIPFSVSVNAEEISWHQSLDSQFDIVETFDHLQDWNPLKTGYHYHGQDMPKREDGARGMWTNYSNDRLIFAYELVSGEFKVDDDILFENSGINARIIRFHEEDGKKFIQIGRAIDGVSVGDKFSTSSGAKGIVDYIPKWIGDHGKYTLGSGKSLAINYNDFSGGVDGFGPSRLGVFLGMARRAIVATKKFMFSL